MKAAILQCDDVLEKFQDEFGNYPAMVERMFNHLDEAIEFDIYNCQLGQLPENINAYDFYITTGSKAAVYDGLAWVTKLLNFIQLLDENKKKFIGICFGHQLIAVLKGYAVEKSPKGWGVGVAQNQIVAHPLWMEDQSEGINILVSHQDQIVDLPDEANIIASSDFCPYFIVQWSTHFLSIQGHPEWLNDYSRTLMNDRRAIIPANTIERGLNSLLIQPDNQLFVEWVMAFVRQPDKA